MDKTTNVSLARDALARGDYKFTGKPCRVCGGVERYAREHSAGIVSNCVACQKLRAAKYYEDNTEAAKEKMKAWRRRNVEYIKMYREINKPVA